MGETMSLPACEQRVLDRIEKTLQDGDPRLGSMFVIFTRLTRYEAMPRTEQVRDAWWMTLRRRAAIPVAVIAMLSVLTLSWLAPGQRACGKSAMPGHSRSSSHMSSCLPGPSAAHQRPVILNAR